ncbi:MAG: hypothetical protein ACP5NB_08840 [Chloroflexia bacterium]
MPNEAPAGPASFPPLDDLLGEFRRLAESHRKQAILRAYGHSRQGETLLALELGNGPHRILSYAFPQPDEPLGGIALLHLARFLLEEEEPLRSARWLLLPCVDPDGARRNEGWFTHPLDLANYARRHFRPPEGEQVEWTFPSDDPAWPWERPLPETQALQALLDDFRPETLVPLHNALLGGAYAFLSEEVAERAPELPPLWGRYGLPTHCGEAELPFAPVLAPGVYRLPMLREMAAALSAQGIPDPAGLLCCGAPAYLYARCLGRVQVIVPELPLFTVPGIEDTRPAAVGHRQLLEESLEADRAAFARWQALYRRAAPLLEAKNPFRSALENHLRTAPLLLQATARWLEGDASQERPATVAEVVDCRKVLPYLRLLPLGLLEQALAFEGDFPDLPLREEVHAALEKALGDSLSHLRATPIPPATLVQATVEILLRTLPSSLAGIGPGTQPSGQPASRLPNPQKSLTNVFFKMIQYFYKHASACDIYAERNRPREVRDER